MRILRKSTRSGRFITGSGRRPLKGRAAKMPLPFGRNILDYPVIIIIVI
jgi:hypothetical protein